MDWWDDPTVRHAYILSRISILITLLAALGGFAIISVSKISRNIHVLLERVSQTAIHGRPIFIGHWFVLTTLLHHSKLHHFVLVNRSLVEILLSKL
jgi:hypothetical protein